MYSRYPSWVAGDLLSNPLWFVFLTLALFLFTPPSATSSANFAHTLSYFFWGFVFLTLFNTSLVGIGLFMVAEQLGGTLEQILLAPVNRLTLITGRWVLAMLIDLIVITSTAAFLLLFQRIEVDLINPPLLLLTLALLEIALLGLGLMVAALTMRFRSALTAVGFAWLGVVVVSGVFFPVSALPAALKVFSLVAPTTYYVDLIKYSAVGSQSLIQPGLELGLLAALSLLLLVLGWYIFGWAESIVKRSGRAGFY